MAQHWCGRMQHRGECRPSWWPMGGCMQRCMGRGLTTGPRHHPPNASTSSRTSAAPSWPFQGPSSSCMLRSMPWSSRHKPWRSARGYLVGSRLIKPPSLCPSDVLRLYNWLFVFRLIHRTGLFQTDCVLHIGDEYCSIGSDGWFFHCKDDTLTLLLPRPQRFPQPREEEEITSFQPHQAD